MIDDQVITEARRRLRNAARNEQTSVALNELLRLAEQENKRLREENERLQKNAERYLALREQYVELCVADDKSNGTKRFGTAAKIRAEYDSDADRLIQEMLK